MKSTGSLLNLEIWENCGILENNNGVESWFSSIVMAQSFKN